MNKQSVLTMVLASAFCFQTMAQPKTMVVKVNEVKATVQPTMWGVFFEDINMGADGGIYAELVKNRSFEFFKPLMGWTVKQPAEGDVLVMNRQQETNSRFIRLSARNPQKGQLSLTNEGFRGMGIKQNLRYDFSLMYRQQKAGLTLHIELQDTTGKLLGATVLKPQKTGKSWNKESVFIIRPRTRIKL